MRYSRIIVLTAMLGGILVLPALAEAQSRGRAAPRGSVRGGSVRAVPRGSIRTVRPNVIVSPRYFYRPFYRPGVSLGFYYGYPWYVGPYAYGYGYPFGYYGYDYGYGYGGYGYPYGYMGGAAYAARSYGGVRIDIPQKDAEVYVDGYYAGVVDDFDGTLQQVNLEPGPHKIEIRAEGYQPVSFEVNVEPGRTITYRAALRQARP